MTTRATSATLSLLQQAAEWRLLSLLFECPTEGWRNQVAAVSSEVADPDLRAAAQHALAEASEGLYHSLFGPGGPAPPREVSYQDSVQLGLLMSELSGYYEAFAYRPATPEAADHVAVETGFVGYMRLKEAYALACAGAQHASVTAEAARRFIEDHLGRLAEPLAPALRASGVPYLALAAEALLRRAGRPRKAQHPHGLEVLPEVEGCAFDCGEG